MFSACYKFVKCNFASNEKNLTVYWRSNNICTNGKQRDMVFLFFFQFLQGDHRHLEHLEGTWNSKMAPGTPGKLPGILF